MKTKINNFVSLQKLSVMKQLLFALVLGVFLTTGCNKKEDGDISIDKVTAFRNSLIGTWHVFGGANPNPANDQIVTFRSGSSHNDGSYESELINSVNNHITIPYSEIGKSGSFLCNSDIIVVLTYQTASGTIQSEIWTQTGGSGSNEKTFTDSKGATFTLRR